ncbi:unnamed protein product [Ambrosiozyma monospora]|uniref:Unnamed protein product n=1 Tax=Ambrosiozyma monospora TaxID=43982 RepID=A0ACB5TAH9_AMBMO|nr:unnamed protein product [Ambrosiozyma monospora]
MQQQQHQHQLQQSIPGSGSGSGSGFVGGGSVATSNSIKPEKSKKARRKSSSDETKVLISTSSPEGIAAAAQITSNRVANILLSEGPLPIRHLTSHLVSQVPAFGHLSLSKQRRLIMAALESGDSVNCCVFEKVGWGQWEARRTTVEEVNLRINSSSASASGSTANNNAGSGNHHSSSSGSSGSGSLTSNTTSTSVSTNNNIRGHSPDSPVKDEYNNNNSNNNSHRLMNNNYGRRNSKTTSPKPSTVNFRRDSITNPQTDLHNTKLPLSPSLQPLQNLRNSFRDRNIILDEAIESSSEDDDDDELEDTPPLPGDDEDGMFSLDGEYRRRHNTSNNGSGIRSGSNSRRPSFGGIVKPRKPRTSFTSQSIEAALDDSVSLDKRRPRVSFSNSSTVARESFVRKPLSSPYHNPIMMNDQNVSNSTISSSGTSNNSTNGGNGNPNPNGNGNGSKRHSQQYGSNTAAGRTVNGTNGNSGDDEHDNFTDEEDWATNGPPSHVRRQASIVSPPFGATTAAINSINVSNTHLPPITLNNNNNMNGNGKAGGLKNGKSDEEIAAFALMDLRSDV